MINNEIINGLKTQIKEQEAQIRQLYDTNKKLMAIITNMSSSDSVELCETETRMPIVITREFIEFTAIRKVKNCIIPGVNNTKVFIELSMLIKNSELSDYDLVYEFNRIVDRYIYQKMYESTDSGIKRAVELLKEFGYEKIETSKGLPATGPYWERTIGGGVRVDVVYRPPFKLAYNNGYFYLRGICSTR